MTRSRVTRSLVTLPLVTLSVLATLPVMAAPPVFTGLADVDFADTGVYVTHLDDFSPTTHQTDVPLPVDCIQSSASGIDIKSLWLHYDPPTDTLSVGIETWVNLVTGKDVVAGDVDGDGTGGSSCSVSDIASFGGSESVCLYVGPNANVDPTFIFGKENSKNGTDTIITDFRAAPFVYTGGANVPIPPDSFGASALDVDLFRPVDPRPSYPHVEFRIGRFGALLGFDPLSEPVVFSYGGFMGVAYVTIPSDFAPDTSSDALALELALASFPDPRAGLTGHVTQDWINSDPRDGTVAPPGTLMHLTGEFVAGTSTTKTFVVDAAGNYASYSGSDFQSIRLGDYVMEISPPFGYAVKSTTVSHPTGPVSTEANVVNVTFGLQEEVTLDVVLVAIDSDGDGIPDVEEEPNPVGCLADSAECLDADDDGTPNYLDIDSDDDGIPDGDEDTNLNGVVDDGETDPNNSDSDGDSVHDGTEVGITSPTVDTSTTVNPIDGEPNYIPDADPATTTDPLDQDTDDDGIPDGIPTGTPSNEVTPASGEDANHNGQADVGETDPSDNDSDDDALLDGTELGVTTPEIGDDTDPDLFEPDADGGQTTTDPVDDDSDDDGLVDGNLSGEPGGAGGEDVNLNGVKDTSETNPNDADTDNDCVQDGTESGLNTPQGDDTDTDVFEPDISPNTTTNPLIASDNPDSCPTEVTPTPSPEPSGIPDGIAMGDGGIGSCSTAPDGRPGLLFGVVGLAGLFIAYRRRSLRHGTPTQRGNALRSVSRRGMTLGVGLGVASSLFVGLGAGLMPGMASAQTSASVEVQQFHPAEDLAGTIMTSGSTTIQPGHVTFGVWANYAVNPLVYVGTNGERLYVLQEGVLGADIVGGIGVTKFLQLGVGLPVTLYQLADSENPFANAPAATALNDISLKLRLRLLKVTDGLGVAIEPKVWIPTGSANSYTGGKFNMGGALVVDRNLGHNWVGLNVGYRYRPETENLANLMVGSEVYYRAGLGIAGKLSYFSLDLYGTLGTVDQTVDLGALASKPLEIMAGVSRPLGKNVTATLALGTGIIAGYGSPDFRAALGFTFGAPRASFSDRDGDGIIDNIDNCPDDPEDFDGFQDTDGCPDPDNDNDGIPDVKDKCPNDPEDLDGFEDEDGCPDPDNDKDTIVDIKDKCPNDPEDFDGFQDVDGCPDPDNDNDGILDATDKCPNDPEDKDGFEDEDGCPDPDNDKDRILDVTDKCPNYPENYNGFEDEDGCPDVIGPVKVIDNRLQLGMILFEWDKDIILPQSSVVLDLAVQVFKDNPTVRARIEGHTSSEGTVEHNQDLSERRAIAVKKYMVKHGIKEDRFEVKGMASTQPIVQDDNTEELRAKNRRMEWVILVY